jgi:hypothetical protein
MHVLHSFVSLAATVIGIVSGVVGLRNGFKESKTQRELEDHKLALARCQRLWQWAALIVIVAGIILLVSRYSLDRSLAA